MVPGAAQISRTHPHLFQQAEAMAHHGGRVAKVIPCVTDRNKQLARSKHGEMGNHALSVLRLFL